jgi:hypothetical protein
VHAKRLPVGQRAEPSDAHRAAAAAASATLAGPPSSAAAASPPDSGAEFPPRDYHDDVLRYAREGIRKYRASMPALPAARRGEWDDDLLLARVDALYTQLHPSIRLVPSHPAGLVQRKKTLACNLAFSVAPYEDVNGKPLRAEFARLFGAAKNAPVRLTEEFVPEAVKERVQRLDPQRARKAADSNMRE